MDALMEETKPDTSVGRADSDCASATLVPNNTMINFAA